MSDAAAEIDEQDEKTPAEWAQHWKTEIAASQKALESWHKKGSEVVKVYLDERTGNDDTVRWTLFTANVQTYLAMLYGKTPQASVSRKFADALDDQGRVAAEMLERGLNSEIEKESDGYAAGLGYALMDYLLPGLAQGRVYYDVTTEDIAEEPAKTKTNEDGTVTELAAKVPAYKKKSGESCECCYVHWRDFLWSVERTWRETRWVAFRAKMSRKQFRERFGKEKVPLVAFKTADSDDKQQDPTERNPLARCDVWEIWDKETKKVFFYAEGATAILDTKDDPLGLDGFFPCPRPMMANLTTDRTIPRPTYVLTQDLYREVNNLSSRIHQIQEAIKVGGFYDKELAVDLQNLLRAGPNELKPVNWPLLMERGGLAGVVQWFPIEQWVAALQVLVEQRQVAVDAIYQITGQSDIMRGQSSGPAVTASEQAIKARFGSVRVQALQDEFARFASDLQRLKAEVMAKHMEPATIIEMSNVMHTPDAALAEQAVALIKSKGAKFRIEVKPEAVAMTDFAQVKQDRTEVVASLAQYFTAAAPLAEQMPGAVPYLLQIAQWLVAGLRGASTIEGVFDQAVAAAQQAEQQAAANPQPQQEDPKVTAQRMKLQGDQMKAESDMRKEQAKVQGQIALEGVKVQADAQREQNQALWNTREAAMRQQIEESGEMHQAKVAALRNPKPAGGGA